MSLLAVPIIAVLALFLVLLTSTFFFVYLNRLKEEVTSVNMQIKSTTLQVNDLIVLNSKLQQKIDVMENNTNKLVLENSQVSSQLELRIKNLQIQVIDQQQLLTQWQDNQGQEKFYSRAFKLASKGADIEEIMSECELPRAEVEMLLSVYKQRVRSE
jgi:CRISPR/Cas system CMR subunit Cmr4 (Cas7 group RAMP superfamily)